MTHSTRFAQSVAANLAYWLERTSDKNFETLQALSAEQENLQRAIEFGQQLESTWIMAARLNLQCYDLIDSLGHGAPWIPQLKALLTRCPDDMIDLKCQLLNRLGNCYRLERRLDAAEEIHLQEKALALQSGIKERLAYAHVSLSHVYWMQRQYEKAEHHGLQAWQGFVKLDAPANRRASTMVTLGLIARGRGELDLAEERLRLGIGLWRETGNTVSLVRSLNSLAMVLEAAGRAEEALLIYREAEALLAPTLYETDKTLIFTALGTLYFNQGRLDEAETAYKKANSPYIRYNGHPYWKALVANNLGNVYLVLGRLDEAEEYLKRSIVLWRSVDARIMLANTLGDLANTTVAQGDRESAAPLYEEAIAICRDYPEDAWGMSLLEKFERELAALTL